MIIVNALFLILVSFISLYLTLFISNKFNLFDYPDKKKIHLTKTPNIAGIAIIFTILTSFFIYDYSFDNILIFLLSLLIIMIGFIDDLKNIKALLKLILISIPVVCFIYKVSDISSLGNYFGYDLSLGKFSFFFTFMCMLLLINATNYMDGLDGLVSLLAILSFLFILILIPKEEWNSLLPIIYFLIIFLFFNFGILPKQFLGDSGSLCIGFILSSFSIYFTQELELIHPAIIIWCLSFYVYEFLTINIIRLKNKQNLFKKDLNFIFNILQNKVGKINTLIICCVIKIFFLVNGLIFNYKNFYDYSILFFIIYFMIYLGLRIKLIK